MFESESTFTFPTKTGNGNDGGGSKVGPGDKDFENVTESAFKWDGFKEKGSTIRGNKWQLDWVECSLEQSIFYLKL